MLHYSFSWSGTTARLLYEKQFSDKTGRGAKMQNRTLAANILIKISQQNSQMVGASSLPLHSSFMLPVDVVTQIHSGLMSQYIVY